ncbi:alpha/beta hydrolase [Holzapfeliella sp. He02]|uniref:Alpha/beta hydrolase n=1 Tax=Holzapfeliella saturejae TaxID=3082953 RepID=A0ABU8SG38_9LACO
MIINYIDNKQFNFQINRFMESHQKNQLVQEELFSACQDIANTEDWYKQWFMLGQKHVRQQHYAIAASFFQMADFFLRENDYRKNETYTLFIQNYYKGIDTSNMTFSHISYENRSLTSVLIKNSNATKTLLFHGGFDSYLEELIQFIENQKLLENLPTYNFILFEGPGQGKALKDGLPMIYNWEKPVKVVLDYYKLAKVDLLGMSLGGYLSLRAAAYEPRIKKVIAYDVMYDMFSALFITLPELTRYFDPYDKEVSYSNMATINTLIKKSMRENNHIAFLINKCMDITLTSSPAECLITCSDFTLKNVLKEVKQEVLLLAGTQDIYVPVETIGQEQRELINAKSIVTKLFTEKSGGSGHCQIGYKYMAAQIIAEFLNNKL